ncbi:MAG: undecaprenyl-phosphate alpha-N-acetylglucosaminyl 1-phosphate transferase [Planctomycetes bacterium]|nr:undecaprenyl-phosphate alpha-N-acetylglucosaminyl 1-phosphate transferase [Planctomycetota bacterium]
MTLIRAGFLLFGLSLGLAALVLPMLERRAMRSGPVDQPGGRKDHGRTTPLTGGIAILLAVTLPAVVGLLVALLGEALVGDVLPEEIALHLEGIRTRAGELLVILLGAGVLMIVGHLDDRHDLSAWLRLLTQVACASALVFCGVRITLFLPWPWLHGVVTVLFVVFITNAVNFVDNMNGLCGGLVLIGGLHLLALAVATNQLFMAAILICLAGGLTAFLPRNFPVARSFLGDAGSTALGFLLASLTVAFTFTEGGPAWRPVVLPILVLAIPIADGVTVIAARLARGVHPFTAGHDHLSHRIVRSGLTPVGAVLVLWGVQFVVGVPLLIAGDVGWPIVAAVWGPVAAVAAFACFKLRLRSREASA